MAIGEPLLHLRPAARRDSPGALVQARERFVQRRRGFRGEVMACAIAPMPASEQQVEEVGSTRVSIGWSGPDIALAASGESAQRLQPRRARRVSGCPRPVVGMDSTPIHRGIPAASSRSTPSHSRRHFVRHSSGTPSAIERHAPSRKAAVAASRAVAEAARAPTSANGRVIKPIAPNATSPIASDGLPRWK